MDLSLGEKSALHITFHSDNHLEYSKLRHELPKILKIIEKWGIQSLDFQKYRTDFPLHAVDSSQISKLHYCVMAGDIGDLNTVPIYFRILSYLFPNMKIIYVLGNHEYYGLYWEEAVDNYKDALKDLPNVIVLENELYQDDDNQIVFCGSTLWTNLALHNNVLESQRWVDNRNQDTADILTKRNQSYWDTITSEMMIDRFNESIVKIKEHMKYISIYCPNYNKVMVSHFLPHKLTSHPKFKDTVTSPYWCSHVPELFDFQDGQNWDLWIYGHSHNNVNVLVGNTKVMSNQIGYRSDYDMFDSLSVPYNPNLILEL